MATKRKIRKFADGGSSIDEDVRARAMKYVEGLEGVKGSGIADETGEVKGSIKRNEYGDLYDSEMKAPKATTTVSRTPTKAPPAPAEEKARIEAIGKKQGLERVTPEEMIIGGGAGKLLQMAGKKLSSKIAANREVKRRTSEGFSPAEALAAREKVKTDELIKKAQKQTRIPKSISKAEQEARKERYLSTGPMEDAFGTGSQFKRGFKSGGSVKTSASKRADGCAVRGKTRA